MTEWRLNDWVNSFQNSGNDYCDVGSEWEWIQKKQHEAYKAGASAMLAALLKWLKEPCDCLDYAQIVEFTIDVKGMYPHRKDCPQCMAELRGER